MARTNTQNRQYVDRIIRIKLEIDELTCEKQAIAKKLGLGTWRSSTFPGLMAKCYIGSNGWKVSWKGVALALAKRLGLSDREIEMAKRGHQSRTYSHPGVTVSKCSAKVWGVANPKINIL